MQSRTILLALAALSLAACGRETSARAAAVPDSATRADTGSTTQVVKPASASEKSSTKSAAKSAASAKPARDSLRYSIAPGRSAHDSASFRAAIRAGMNDTRWPVKGPAALPGSILPAKRIVAFYGNPLSKQMGVLGEYPVDEMLAKLDHEVARWQKADPSTPVQPALHLIAVVAQGAPGRDGMYRLRMDSSLIEKVYGWAQRKNALLFLDIQVGHSTVQAELPRLLKFLERPNVELGLDPEFSMHYDKEGIKPSKKIGTMMAADVNYAVQTLSRLVAEKKIPPKILVVHRFTKKMVPNAEEIRPDSRVQVVMDMDGWGPPWLKFDSYRDYEVAHPVEFTGFKIFFHNDTKKGDTLITPEEILQLRPKPLYIQYQ